MHLITIHIYGIRIHIYVLYVYDFVVALPIYSILLVGCQMPIIMSKANIDRSRGCLRWPYSASSLNCMCVCVCAIVSIVAAKCCDICISQRRPSIDATIACDQSAVQSTHTHNHSSAKVLFPVGLRKITILTVRKNPSITVMPAINSAFALDFKNEILQSVFLFVCLLLLVDDIQHQSTYEPVRWMLPLSNGLSAGRCRPFRYQRHTNTKDEERYYQFGLMHKHIEYPCTFPSYPRHIHCRPTIIYATHQVSVSELRVVFHVWLNYWDIAMEMSLVFLILQ